MNEKDEALEVAAALRQRIAKLPSWDSTRTLLVCDDAARCIEKLHADNERLTAEIEQLTATAFQAQNAAIDLAYRYQRMREVLERIAYASMSMHQNAAHMVMSLQGIAQAALKEPPR